MSEEQQRKHALGRFGERIAQSILGGELTNHTHPFDLLDVEHKIAYEIKTMRVDCVDYKVCITAKSLRRKINFSRKFSFRRKLILIIVDDNEVREVYQGTVKKAIRKNQMKQIFKS